MSEYAKSLVSGLLDIAGDYVRSEVRVSLKTNLTPEIPIWRGSATGGGKEGGSAGKGGGLGLGKLLGFKAAVIVRNSRGEITATYGTPPALDPVRIAILLALVGSVGYVMVRGLLK